MKPMQAGKLIHRLQLQQDNGTKDAIGGNVASWVDVGIPTWGSVEPLSGRDIILGAQISPDTTHKIRVRFRTGVHSAMRWKWLLPTPRYYSMTGPPLDTETQNRELVCMCKEVETVT